MSACWLRTKWRRESKAIFFQSAVKCFGFYSTLILYLTRKQALRGCKNWLVWLPNLPWHIHFTQSESRSISSDDFFTFLTLSFIFFKENGWNWFINNLHQSFFGCSPPRPKDSEAAQPEGEAKPKARGEEKWWHQLRNPIRNPIRMVNSGG